MPIGFVHGLVNGIGRAKKLQEKQKQELLQVAAKENALIEDKCFDTNENVPDPYDPNPEPSIPIPTWLLFPKMLKIRQHAYSPLHQTPKTAASHLRKNLIRSPCRRHSKALVFEELQTPIKPPPKRGIDWSIAPLKLKDVTKADKLECELKTIRCEVKGLRRK
jgi:hypothetical protein